LSLFFFFLSSLLLHMPPRKPRKKSGTDGQPPASGRGRKKATTTTRTLASGDAGDPEEADEGPKAPARVVWDRYPMRTERLLDYLESHVDVALKLFGDSTRVAKTEGRSKVTAKSNKATAYLQVADGVFSLDEDATVRADFISNPTKYAKAVDNYITNS
jgi:hypothetical protein